MGTDESLHQSDRGSYEVSGREVTIRDGLSREEMNVQTRKGRKLPVVGEYQNHTVSIHPSLVPYPRAGDQPETKPPTGYVKHEQNHWGRQRRDARGGFYIQELMSAGQMAEGCVPALSDILCGVDPGDALSRRLGGIESTYATAVVDFPGDETQRRGIILLSATADSGYLGPLLRVRVIGESHSYAGSHQYDAEATASPSSARWWVRHIDELAQEVTARVMAGAPAAHAFPEGLAGKRGPQRSTFREEFSKIKLSGLERMVGARLAQHVDLQNAASEDLQWAESGPTIWSGISTLHKQRRDAAKMEQNLLGELARVGAYDKMGHWIFRPEIPFDTVRNDLLIG
ncbi:MAG: hypothetical protein DI630_16540 [Gordonia sp. (in: high G+C Gram-positive bacteria)]|nr:MAG: hypothetical protein DI630_16540 [Gordonia sp. (in: high G+C Gram-positive bacteria)]